jgi:flagellar motor switch protein FliG
MSSKLRYESLSGQQKAAIFMLAVSEDHATKLFSMLELDEVKDVSHTMAGIGRVDSDTVELLLQEFGVRLHTAGGVSGGLDTTEKLLMKFLDASRVEDIMEEIRGPAGRTVWDKLGNVNETVLASFLKNEYPQTVAVVLSRLNAAHSARVLATFPEEFALDVVLRMLKMEVVQKEVITDVERTLRAEFVSNLAKTTRRDNFEIMAEIFNHFDKMTETRLLEDLDRTDKEMADRIRQLMFTFEDLLKVDRTGIQLLIRRAGQERVGKALKGGSEQLTKFFLENMSERGGKLLLDEMRSMGPVRVRDVEEAQQFMVNLAKELAAAGEIQLANQGEEEMVY